MELITLESPVIAPFEKYKRFRGENIGRRFVETLKIRKVHKGMRTRFPWRSYVSREYFGTQLLIAESRGKMA